MSGKIEARGYWCERDRTCFTTEEGPPEPEDCPGERHPEVISADDVREAIIEWAKQAGRRGIDTLLDRLPGGDDV